MSSRVDESRESLWRLVAAPLVWAAHLLASYGTAAIACEKLGVLEATRWAIGAFTALALALIAVFGVQAYRRHRYGDANGPHDFDSPQDRHRFLGFATLLLAGLSGVAVVFQALPALIFGSCR